MSAPVTAQAATSPCQLYAHSAAPRPSRTQSHHRLPQYLQERVWGAVRVQDRLDLCGLCHDSVHDVISWLLGEARKPNPMPGRKAVQEARRTVDWYLRERVAAMRGAR